MPVQTPDSPPIIKLRPPEVEIDMQDLAHTMLDDAGNLELHHDVHQVELQLGGSALKLTRIAQPLAAGQYLSREEREERPHAYALSNEEGSYDSIMYFGNTGDGDNEIIIGRETTPGLVKDNPTVSRRHAKIELDPEAKRIRIRDLDSTNGTKVNVRVDKVASPKGKEFTKLNGRPATNPEVRGRWIR